MADSEATETERKEAAESRAEELMEMGVSPQRARAKACEEMGVEDIAGTLGTSDTAARSYLSKFNDDVEDSLRLLLSHLGGSASILAEQDHWDSYHLVNKLFITAPFNDGPSGPETYQQLGQSGSESRVVLISVSSGGPSGEPVGSVGMSSKTYNSLDQLVEDKYRGRESIHYDEAVTWYNLISDAGGDELINELPDPEDIAKDSIDNPDFDPRMEEIRSKEARRGRERPS